jgi:hypothetical protein
MPKKKPGKPTAEDKRAVQAAIAKLLREGKARSYYDPERRELVFFRPKPQTPPPVE